MVKSILEGKKSVTRRPVKPQPPEGFYLDLCHYSDTGWSLWHDEGCTCKPFPCKYNTGDILWVRETWQPLVASSGETVGYHYFTGDVVWKQDTTNIAIAEPKRWYPSIHMPREAARLFLQVKNVRAERLQEITEDDALAEGVSVPFPSIEIQKDNWKPRKAFKLLWDSIYGDKYPWDSNPWVWVTAFERAVVSNG